MKNTSKKINVSEEQQGMVDFISGTFSKLGIQSVQFGAKGKTFIDTKKKQLRQKKNK